MVRPTQGVVAENVTVKGDVAWWDRGKLDQGRAVGEIYCTAVYAMILAMPYHYVPLYQR